MTESIVRVGLTHLQIPFKEPLRTATGEFSVKDAVLVAVETAHGHIGMGECSPLPGPHGASDSVIEACWRDLVERIGPRLLSARFGTIEGITAQASAWAGCNPCAIAGAETALWDLLGQARGLSLAELFGTASEMILAGVESGLTVGIYPTVVDLLRAIESHMASGYRRVKLKIGPGQDMEFVAGVRQHFGPDMLLCVDGDGAYTRDDIELLCRLDDYDLLMIEQPMAADDLDGLAALQAAVSTPICLDQTASSPERTAEALDRGCGQIVNLKIQRLGGFGPSLAVHEVCRRRDASCWVGTTPELGVGQAQGIHLGTLPNCRFPTDVTPSSRWFVDDYVAPLIEMSSPGHLLVPERAGLGYQVDEMKLKRYRLRHQELARSAGS